MRISGRRPFRLSGHGIWPMLGALVFTGALQAGVIEEKRPSTGARPPLQVWSSPGERSSTEDIVAGDVPPVDSGVESTQLSDQVALRLQGVILEDSTILDESAVEHLTGAWMGRDISVSELHDLRLALTEEYVNRGYVTSGVVIPDQTVEDGVLRVRAVENTITSIRVGEDTRINEHYVEHRLQRLLAGPVNVVNLKDALRYLEADPMISHVVARLQPGDRRGESHLDLDIIDQPRFALELGVDNARASSVGEERARLGFSARNLSGDGDYVQVTRGFTEGVDELSALVELPLTYFDLRGQMYYSSGEARIIESRFKDLDIRSDSETFGLSFSQPVHRSEHHLVTVSLGFEKKENRSELLDFPFSFSPGAVDGRSRVTTATLEASWTGRGDNYVVNTDLAWRRGLDLLNPTLFRPRDRFDSLANPTGADGEFDVWLVQIGSVYRLNALPVFDDANDLVQLRFRMLLQRASEALMSFERVAIGGASTVRGFSENLFVRDNGLAASIELQVPFPGQFDPQGWRNILLLFFIDYGRGWDERNVEVLNPSRDSTRVIEIASAGMGFVWNPGANFRLSASWAHPIESGPDSDELKNSLQARGFNVSAGWVLRF